MCTQPDLAEPSYTSQSQPEARLACARVNDFLLLLNAFVVSFSLRVNGSFGSVL